MPVREQVQYTVLFEPAEEGGYVVTCPALPGLVTEGDTLAQARIMAVDAIRAYLDSLLKDGQPIPADKKLSADPATEATTVT
jgi:predicted RNase H-like HicB family nuclease